MQDCWRTIHSLVSFLIFAALLVFHFEPSEPSIVYIDSDASKRGKKHLKKDSLYKKLTKIKVVISIQSLLEVLLLSFPQSKGEKVSNIENCRVLFFYVQHKGIPSHHRGKIVLFLREVQHNSFISFQLKLFEIIKRITSSSKLILQKIQFEEPVQL